MDIARFEDAAVKPTVAPTRSTRSLASVLEVSASSLGCGATISIDGETALMAAFDPALVERVLHSLVGNASRHGNQSGTSIALAARRGSNSGVELAVTNSGPRIGDEPAESIPAALCGSPGAHDAISSARGAAQERLSINSPAARRGLG